MLMRRYGRLPVLFWSQVLSLAFLFGNTFSPNLSTFAAMRCLNGFFGTTPQVTGLYVITDMFPFHLQARKLNIWTMGFIVSPFLSPMAFGFLVARASWRWCYGIACMYGAAVLALIVFFGEETMYDRTLKGPRPYPLPKSWLRRRLELLVGAYGTRMAKFRVTWCETAIVWVQLAWRPHVFGILLFEAMLFGFSIGINVTNNIFLAQPPPVGYGFDQIHVAGVYATPVVAVVLGELFGRYLNDWIMRLSIRRNGGVFEAESRLWACYVAVALYTCGMLLLGAGLQKHLTIAAFIIGWGLVEIATMVNTTVVYVYLNDSFPKYKGEMSALLNLARTLGGFSVAYFQVPWAVKHGALQTLGCEAAIVGALFMLVVPVMQIKGQTLRVRFSM
ncbi:MFS general substrate transporter [Phanerochaete sordida]|uniref:MFS general substrate transporter n=1 Tax=Phanerochaete sordida TaxID=48140 RepID=A0A9P3G4E0_9APHY|nr:MFS general substrate transporter [Phanerochaete sordida]